MKLAAVIAVAISGHTRRNKTKREKLLAVQQSSSLIIILI